MADPHSDGFGESAISSMRDTGRSKHLKFDFDGKMVARTPNGSKIIKEWGDDLATVKRSKQTRQRQMMSRARGFHM